MQCPGFAENREGFSRHITHMLSAWISAGLSFSESKVLKTDKLREAQQRIRSQAPQASVDAAQHSSQRPSCRMSASGQRLSGQVERHLSGNAHPSNPVVVLFRPEIPPNAGSVARLCAAFRLRLVLIGPLGFDVTEKAFRRAGLDYWPWVDLDFFADWRSFRQCPDYAGTRAVFVETTGSESVHTFAFQPRDLLVFGSETSGLPDWLLSGAASEHSVYAVSTCAESEPRAVVRIPMQQPHVRSINLANSVAIVASHALGHLN